MLTQSKTRALSKVVEAFQPDRLFLLVLALVLLSAAPAGAAQSALPAGVPDIFDPEVRTKFQPTGVISLYGNPDFPVLLLLNTVEEQPQAMMLGLDARNGKDSWSLVSDPIVLIILFADPVTILGAYVDAGFSREGRASGDFITLENPNSLTLPDLLKAVTAVPTRTYM